MTDRNAILEALTAKMEEIWNDDLSFEDQAAAVLELVGPKPLHWMNNGNLSLGKFGWVVRKMGGQYVLTKASRLTVSRHPRSRPSRRPSPRRHGALGEHQDRG